MSARLLLVCAVALLTATAPSPAHAGWSADPVQVYATPNGCSQVAVGEDAGFGAIVMWDEAGQPLRAAHLLPTGELDPAWPAFVDVAGASVQRTALELIPDGAGGVFAFWLDGTTEYAQHLLADGTRHASWPAAGRALRTLLGAGFRADVHADGDGGFWMAWVQNRVVPWNGGYANVPSFMLDRRGPDGAPRPGWSAGGRAIGVNVDALEFVGSCAIAPAPDGGLWAAWTVTTIVDDGGTAVQVPGESRLVRLQASGARASGWGALGVSLAPFPAEAIPAESQWGDWTTPKPSLVGVADDGLGGAFVEFATAEFDWSGQPLFHAAVQRVDGSGARAAGWSATGVPLGWSALGVGASTPADAGFRMIPGRAGEVYATTPVGGTDVPPAVGYTRVRSDRSTADALGGSMAGLEVARAGDGSFVLADFFPRGPMGWADDVAHVRAGIGASTGYFESHPQPAVWWYGDVGVAGLRDGGAILAWSQSNQRYGVFAVRLNAAGLVTGVPPAATPAAPRLALRFVPGQGVRASAAFGAAGEARLVLTDVLGRAVARETFAARTTAREWTLAGTEALAPGLYFARVTRGAETHGARVVITR